MLNYWFEHNGQIGATYNGRVGFIFCQNSGEVDFLRELRRQNDFAGLWALSKDNSHGHRTELVRAAAHELIHKHAFSYSRAGLILTGWRSWVRVRYMFVADTFSVERYYRARTIYFAETRGYQERLVEFIEDVGDNIDSGAVKRAVEIDFAKEFASVEAKVQETWLREGLRPNGIERFFFHWNGRVLQESFALVVGCGKDETWSEEWIADGGLHNDLGVVRPKETPWQRQSKRLLNAVRIEKLAKRQSFQTDLEWFRICVAATYQMLRGNYEYDEERFRVELAIPTARFVSLWSGATSVPLVVLLDIIEDAAFLSKEEFFRRWPHNLGRFALERSVQKFVNYFYLHGN